MTETLIRKAVIHDFGIYEQDGTIVLGYRFDAGAPFNSLIFQIETANSDQRSDVWGMYSEFDGKGVYGAVTEFDFNPQSDVLAVSLDPVKSGGIDQLSIEVPSIATAHNRQLLTTMARIFRDYPAPS